MIGEYLRLSERDEDRRYGEKPESNSVVNQRGLINHFIKNHPDLSECKTLEFIDDGRSGTNLTRPGFQALLAAAKRGEIDCVIVKDLSRFARNYLDAGECLEHVFPFLGVRFIAINDGYDSASQKYRTAGNLDLGFRNLINELYSQDLSVRVKAAKKQYAQRGECIAAYAFYGYVKSKVNSRRLEIDEPAAEVVREIFKRRLDGQTPSEIAQHLNHQAVPTPMIRKQQLGVKRKSWSKSREVNQWDSKRISQFLRDERYTGKLISGKSGRYEVGNPELRPLPQAQWIVVEDAHPAIVSPELFGSVQKPCHRAPPSPVKKSRREHRLFYRKIKCGICGMGLDRRQVKRPYYCCDSGISGSDSKWVCASVRIYEDELMATVLSTLRHLAALAATAKTESREKNRVHEERKRGQSAQICSLQASVEKHWACKKSAFTKFNAGQYTQAEYNSICAECNLEITRLCGQLAALEQSGVDGNDRVEHSAHLETLQGIGGLTELTRELVDSLIDVIRVYGGGRIEIVWKFRDEYEDWNETIMAERGTV